MIASTRKARGPFWNRPSAVLAVLLFVVIVVHLLTPGVSSWYLKTALMHAQVQSGYDGPDGAPIDLGPIGARGGRSAMRAAFSFEASESPNHPNLFQTAPGNTGIRLELNDNVLAMIVSQDDVGLPPAGVIISAAVKPATRHSVEVLAIQGRFIEASFDGKRIASPYIPGHFSTSDVRFGNGYDESRNFAGSIRDIEFSSGDIGHLVDAALFVNRYFYIFIAVISLAILANITIHTGITEEHLAKSAALKQYVLDNKNHSACFFFFVSLFLSIAGMIYFFAYKYFAAQYGLLRLDILAGFKTLPGARHFKSEFLVFVLLELTLIGALGLAWASSPLIGRWRRGGLQTSAIVCLPCLLSAIALLSIDNLVSRLMFAIAFAIPVVFAISTALFKYLPNKATAYGLAVSALIFQLPVRFCGMLHRLSGRLPLAASIITILRSGALKVSAFLILLALLSYPIFATWYPVDIPNDYVELPDSIHFSTDGGEQSVGRKSLVDCLVSEPQGSPACPGGLAITTDERADLRATIQASGLWRSEPGRLLFHHSYLYVPAKHLLTYGFDGAVPYLYGYGNTMFHAGLMMLAGGPSLSHYFLTFPIAEYTGILAAGALVLWLTGSATAGFVAILLSLSAFYLLSYTYVFLAASFSPMRLFGLMIQIWAMAFFCRSRSPARFVILPLSTAVSLFWNREFGQIGAIGQALVIVAPHLALDLRHRISLMVALFASAAIASIYPTTSTDIVNTVGLSFFNISQQSIPKREFAWLLLYVAIAHAALFALSMAFRREERALRLALIPVLALTLVKYVYNPAAPHFYIMCTLLWPMAVIYLPWRRVASGPALPSPYPFLVAFGILIFAIQNGLSYQQSASDFRSRFTRPFDRQPWSALNETISFATPEEPIRSRVAAIESHMQPGDKILLLSPFDHVLNFYVNPSSYCGHFELFSNFATNTVEKAVSSCVSQAKQLLVVYDKALETPCPTDDLQAQPLCRQRAQMKYNLTSFRNTLLPMLKPDGAEGDLVFYRRDGKGETAK